MTFHMSNLLPWLCLHKIVGTKGYSQTTPYNLGLSKSNSLGQLSLYEPELDIVGYDDEADRTVTIATMCDDLTESERVYYSQLIVKAVNAHDALVAALTLIAYRYESGDIGDLINDMPEIEAALEAAK